MSPTNYVLSGQRHAAGFEVDVAGRITPAWEVFVSWAWIPEAEIDQGADQITPAWEVFVSWAWIPDAEIDKGADQINAAGLVTCSNCSLQGEPVGTRPGLTPEHSATVWSTYKLTPRWRVGGGLNARSDDKPAQSSVRAPGFVTADLMAEYDAGPLVFKLNVTNVFDKTTADVLYRGHKF